MCVCVCVFVSHVAALLCVWMDLCVAITGACLLFVWTDLCVTITGASAIRKAACHVVWWSEQTSYLPVRRMSCQLSRTHCVELGMKQWGEGQHIPSLIAHV